MLGQFLQEATHLDRYQNNWGLFCWRGIACKQGLTHCFNLHALMSPGMQSTITTTAKTPTPLDATKQIMVEK